MTDKQIIIDGVDVSGCPHYQTIGYLSQKDEGIEDYCNLFVYSCKNANCHYKKWQRKEQECEELKNIIDEAKNSKLDLKSFLVGEAVQNEYEQQLDQLKEESEKAKQIIMQAIEDFSLECGTPYYDRLLENAKVLGIEVSDYE